ncbi:MAG: hypothetical protein J1F63_09375 [Oscillospiraceae bacterium]|nr:hypothetical protein [Oscillospiraceae bacterium]
MKKVCAIIFILLLLSGCAELANSDKVNIAEALILQVSETSLDGMTRYFHPYGFALTAPSSFEPRQELLDLELRLERDDCVIEVLPQKLEEGVSPQVYSSYSNGFLRNEELHYLDGQENTLLSGRSALLTRWHREKSGEGDRNYYALADVYDGDMVYTIFLKADRDVETLDFDYRKVFDSLETGRFSYAIKHVPVFTNDHRSRMNAETAALYEEYFGDNGKFHWGMYYHRQPVDGMEKFELLEKYVGDMDMVLLYTEIYDEYDPYMAYGGMVNAWESGKICEVTLQLDIHHDESDVYEILRGEHDNFLYPYAEDIARFGHPIFMRLFNEMNGEWCEYSGFQTSRDPDVYLRLYKYIYNIFEEVGADNVIWVWNPNEKSYPTFNWNDMLLYYPGDEYVDVIGLSGYNTGTGIPGEIWRSFSEIYDGYYEYMRDTFNKPMMITEFGCALEGGDKLRWVEEMFRDLPEKYPEIRAAVWLHERDTNKATGETTRSFFLDDTPGLPELFKENLDKLDR